MLTCEKCGIEYENSKYLNKKKIKENRERYLHTCSDCRKIKKCENCGSEFKHHQNKTCSRKCAKELKEKSYLISQGTSHNFSKNAKSRIKFEDKLKSEEGISNVFQRETVKDSISKTMVSRYGVDNISKDQDIKARKKETLSKTLIENPDLFKNKWWKKHKQFIDELGYDPRLGILGKASIESMQVFTPILDFCKDLNIDNKDIYIGFEDKSEFCINIGSKTYFYDFCIRSKKLIIEFHGIGFHANPDWDKSKLNEWRSAFTGETSNVNIHKTLVKNNAAIRRGFKVLEIWSDNDINYNINLSKKFINDNI
jgi:very-short-patch-repair endonuclease